MGEPRRVSKITVGGQEVKLMGEWAFSNLSKKQKEYLSPKGPVIEFSGTYDIPIFEVGKIYKFDLGFGFHGRGKCVEVKDGTYSFKSIGKMWQDDIKAKKTKGGK